MSLEKGKQNVPLKNGTCFSISTQMNQFRYIYMLLVQNEKYNETHVYTLEMKVWLLCEQIYYGPIFKYKSRIS